MSDPTSIKTQSESERLVARALLYQGLSLFFRHPGQSREHLADPQRRSALLEAAQVFELSEKLESALASLDKEDLRAWTQQYEKLLGHTAHAPVPAYELEYGEEHSHRQPQALADVTAYYQAFGLEISKNIFERPDHAGVECEFAYYLICKEIHLTEQGLCEQALICRRGLSSFLSEHLAYWLPAFAKRLSKQATGAMKLMAEFALQFLAEDCRGLGIGLGPSDLPIRGIEGKEETGCVSCQC
jgi:TorA maturation chaperone TorD